MIWLTVIPSISYSFKVLRRNLKRTTTLMLGILLATGVITSLITYLGYSQQQVIFENLENVKIDLAVHMENKSDTNESSALVQYLNDYDHREIITSIETIAGMFPFRLGGVGGVVLSPYENFSVPTNINQYRQAARSNTLNFTPIFLLAVNFSYFETFNSIFQIKSADNLSFGNNSVFITEDIADTYRFVEGSEFNLSYMVTSIQRTPNGTFLQSNVVTSNLTRVSGIVRVNQKALFAHLAAFNEQIAESSGQQTVTLNLLQSLSIRFVFVDYKWFFSEFAAQVAKNIGLHAVQIKLAHSKLSSDIIALRTQINRLVTYIQQEYYETTIANIIDTTIEAAENEILNLQLALLYFSIPIIVLSILFTKYANDLVLESRKEELIALRTKSLRRPQLVVILLTETIIIATIGVISGIVVGFAIGTLMAGTQPELQTLSILLSFITGLGISLVVALWFIRELHKQGVMEIAKSTTETMAVPFWKRFYLDYIVLSLAFIVLIMKIIDFNPVPGFARSLYNLLTPLFIWFGISLLLSRIFSVRSAYEFLIDLLTKIFRVVWKDLTILYGFSLKRRFAQIISLSLVLMLALSFGFVISNVAATYEVGALQDARYLVGSDIRIKLPASDQLEYNTSDLKNALISNVSDITAIASLYINIVQIAQFTLYVIGIDPNEFLKAAFIGDTFFMSKNAQRSLQELSENPTGSAIISEFLSNPFQSQQGGRIRTTNTQQRVFDIGSQLNLRVSGTTIPLTVTDIALHFPAISDLTGIPDDNLLLLIVNKKLLFDPLPQLNRSLLTNQNATAFLIKTNDEATYDDVVNNIQATYTNYFPTTYPLEITSVTDYLNEIAPLLGLLNALTTLNYGIVLAIFLLGLLIFALYTYLRRRRDFATIIAVGGSVGNLYQLIFLETIAAFIITIVGSILTGIIVSFAYKDFISTLFVLEVPSIVWDYISFIGLTLFSIMGFLMAQLFIYWRGTKISYIEVLREV